MIKYYVCIINKIIYKINYNYYFGLEIRIITKKWIKKVNTIFKSFKMSHIYIT